MTPTVRYPPGRSPPTGRIRFCVPRPPGVSTSYDETVVFNMMGGLSIPDPTAPERVELKGITGLIPPWRPSTRRVPPRTA